MLTKQFHDEAVTAGQASRIERFVGKEILDFTPGQGAALTMVVRLLLNGWITDKEKVFLDSQAPKDCLTFLINDRNYIHPEEVDLFPFEVIETTSLHGGEAIFSHRYQSETMKESRQPYRIFSAAINPKESEKIILGFFGPSHRLGTFDEDCGFARLVYSFREAYSAVRSDLPDLKRYLERNKATLLVDRSTGKTVALNDAASRRFERPVRTMVDVGLDQLKYHLKPLLPRYNLKMENVTAGDLGLAVVTLESNSEPRSGRHDIARTLRAQLTGSAARVSLVSNRLINATDARHPSSPLLRTIRGEADRLGLIVRQYSFLMEQGELSETRQNIVSELRGAVDRVASTSDEEPVIVGSEKTSAFTRVAPDGIYRLLFESIIEGHMGHSGTQGSHWIKMRQLDNSGLHVRFETTPGGQLSANTANSQNEEFVRYLAGFSKTELVKSFCIEDNTLLTELIIKP